MSVLLLEMKSISGIGRSFEIQVYNEEVLKRNKRQKKEEDKRGENLSYSVF